MKRRLILAITHSSLFLSAAGQLFRHESAAQRGFLFQLIIRLHWKIWESGRPPQPRLKLSAIVWPLNNSVLKQASWHYAHRRAPRPLYNIKHFIVPYYLRAAAPSFVLVCVAAQVQSTHTPIVCWCIFASIGSRRRAKNKANNGRHSSLSQAA